MAVRWHLLQVTEMPRAARPYFKVNGQWCYLYCTIDRFGALVDVRLSETRDMEAAKALFRSTKAATGVTPECVTTDGHDSYPCDKD